MERPLQRSAQAALDEHSSDVSAVGAVGMDVGRRIEVGDGQTGDVAQLDGAGGSRERRLGRPAARGR